MLINGVPAEYISASDRGLQYGDGLFETIRIIQGQPLFLQLHLDRLLSSSATLGFELAPKQLLEEFRQLLRESPDTGVAKILVTRGEGVRGYRPSAGPATRILQFYPDPDFSPDSPIVPLTAKVIHHRLAHSQLAGHKHLNRLDQVMGARELSLQYQEGLMLDLDDLVIEGTRSNLFLMQDGQILTPALGRSGVAGVMRAWLIDYLGRTGTKVIIKNIRLQHVHEAEEFFFCNSVAGIMPVKELETDGRRNVYSTEKSVALALAARTEYLTERHSL